MTPEEIIEAYNVLSGNVKDYVAQEAQAIGNSQRSIGGFAERVANPSGQTSGLANYTYNRTLRPTVDTLAASLETQGRSQAMDRYLKDELMKAKNAYEDAKNNYTRAATAPKNNNGGGGNDTYTEQTDTEFTGEQIAYPREGTILGTGSSGNGVYDIIVADGKGGFTTHQYIANSPEEARAKYYAQYGGGPNGSSNESGSSGNGFSGGGGGGGGGGGR